MDTWKRRGSAQQLVTLMQSGRRFLDWLDRMITSATPELSERVRGVCMCDLAAQIDPRDSHRLRRRGGAAKLGVDRIGELWVLVARRVDALVRATVPSADFRVEILEPDWTAAAARRLGGGDLFLRACARACAEASALDVAEEDWLLLRLRTGSLKAAAVRAGCSVKRIQNCCTPVFRKLGIRRFAELPRAIARSIDALANGGRWSSGHASNASSEPCAHRVEAMTERDARDATNREMGHDVEPHVARLQTDVDVLSHTHAMCEGAAPGSLADRFPDGTVHE